MKYEIYTEHAPKEKSPVRLRLVRDVHFRDEVTIFAVDEDGNRLSQGSLLSFLPGGRIMRHTGVNPALGFNLDDRGCIKLEGE